MKEFMKHTPGPWNMQGEGKGFFHIMSDSTTHPRIAEVCKRASLNETRGFETWAESRANAHLIASAPSLLKALRLCLSAAAMNYDPTEEASNPNMVKIGEALDAGNAVIDWIEGRV